jgi:hypothetical protein
MNQSELSEIRTEKLTALFVNTKDPPDESKPLHSYQYSTVGGELTFFRLHLQTYYVKSECGEYSMSYNLLEWMVVEVKPHCQTALKQLVDSMKGAGEFLEEEG